MHDMKQFGISIDTKVIFDTQDSEEVKAAIKHGWQLSYQGMKAIIEDLEVKEKLFYTSLFRVLIHGKVLEGTNSFLPTTVDLSRK